MPLYVTLVLVAIVIYMLVRLESLLVKAIQRTEAVDKRFDYDWTQISGEIRITAYKREGGLICRHEQHLLSLSAAVTMPATGDWFIFERGGTTYRGEVVGREVRFGKAPSETRDSPAGERLHVIIRIDVVCDDEGWTPDAPKDHIQHGHQSDKSPGERERGGPLSPLPA